MDRNHLRGVLLAALACLLVGGSFTANSLLGAYPYAGGQALRYGLAAALLLVLLGRRGTAPLRSLKARQWARLALLAALGMLGFNLAVLAAERTAEPAVPGVLVGCAPVVVAVLAPALAGRRPRPAVVRGALLVAAGAFAVQGWGRTDGQGLVWSAAALCGEVGFALLAVPVLPALGPRLLSAAACALAAAEAAALGLVTQGTSWLRLPGPLEAAALGWQAVVVTVAGFVCWYAGIQRIGAERATLFSGLIPVSAALTAPLAGTGTYGTAQLGGSLLVATGVALGSGVLHRRRRPAATGPTGSTEGGRNRQPGAGEERAGARPGGRRRRPAGHPGAGERHSGVRPGAAEAHPGAGARLPGGGSGG
ncbi:DMT family transporter [Streptomyces sp. RS10V-4]|uniref:DMT family transporter n=1 Tax=Streptomyces rhizoryzae TaxID=2932493 RepID=UPI002003274F|nr:DMT family transporter [Streptomyces rhizoryzae]MCK7626383.1 DMT family transporter [Streptomyces rhizoryzae]